MLCTLTLGACAGEAGPATQTREGVAAAATTPAPAAQESILTATRPATPTHPATGAPSGTARPANTVTAHPTATPASTPDPTPTSTLLPTLTPRPDLGALGFHPVDFASFPVEALWVAPDGRLWVDSEAGLWEYTEEDIFRQRSRTARVQLVGADGQDRIWTLFEDGARVGYHNGGIDWVSFGAAEGWELARDIEFGRGIVVDNLGRVWLALGRAGLRQFDPVRGRWQTWHASDVGFAPPVSDDDSLAYDSRLAFTDVALDSFGNVWTAACAVRVLGEDAPFPILLHRGQGTRWFDGMGWAGPGASGERCVHDLEVDDRGRVWLVGPQNELWPDANNFVRYDPEGGVWEILPVPESSEAFADRPRFARELVFDPTGRPWLFVARRGGATFPPDGVYFQEGGEWANFLEMLPGHLAFGPDETVWLWLEPGYLPQGSPAGLVKYRGGTWEVVPYPWSAPVHELVVDGDGRVWFYQEGDRWTLWYYDP